MPDTFLQFAASWRRPDWYRLLLAYGVKPDSGEQYGGVWESITHCYVACNGLEPLQSCTVYTYQLLWENYDESSHVLEYVSSGRAHLTRQNRWSSEAVWLFKQSQFHLFGSELANFRYALLRGTFVNFIWDMNLEGLQWLKETLHTLAGAQLFEDLGNGNFNILETFFKDTGLAQPQNIGVEIISALSLFGVDIEACMKREFLEFPFGVVEGHGLQLKKRVTFSKQRASGYALDWVWIYDQSAPGYLLLSELSAFSVDSDIHLCFHDDNWLDCGIGPLYANCYDRAKVWRNTGVEKWPPRFERRRAKKERKERARSGQKPTRTKMPGSWVP